MAELDRLVQDLLSHWLQAYGLTATEWRLLAHALDGNSKAWFDPLNPPPLCAAVLVAAVSEKVESPSSGTRSGDAQRLTEKLGNLPEPMARDLLIYATGWWGGRIY